MKIIVTILSFSIFLWSWTLKVDIHNIEPERKGVIWVSIFQVETSKNFPFGKSSRHIRFRPKDKEQTLYFRGLKKGEYAVSIFHDENNNRKPDENFLGFYKEGYGYSNNYRYLPSFKKSQISLNKNSTIHIRMVY